MPGPNPRNTKGLKIKIRGKQTLSDPIQDKMIKERVKLKAPKKAMKKGGRA